MAFKMGGKKMKYDRGRYKESGNTGSRSEKKGGGFLSALAETAKQKRRLKRAKKEAEKIDEKRRKMAQKSSRGATTRKKTAEARGNIFKRRAKQIKDIEREMSK